VPPTGAEIGNERSAHATPRSFPSGVAQAVAGSGHNRAELILDPAELGRLRFDIVTQGNQVQINLSAERPETLDLLRRHSDELRHEFQAAGFDTGSLNFGQWNQQGQDRGLPDAPLGREAFSEGLPAVDIIATPAPRNGPSGTGLDLRL
jgi:flagellar hook-length control protein FliK